MQSRPGGGPSRATRDRAWLASRGLGSRRVRVTAFGVSIALHVLAIGAYTSFMTVLRPDAVRFPIPVDSPGEEGVPLIELIEIQPEEPDQPEEPEEIEEVTAPDVEVRPPFIPGPTVGELAPPGPTAAERLRPNLGDPRLWADPPPEFFDLTVEEREELLLSERIVEWYDSLALARAAEDRLTDWTYRDSKGGRWGVADGKIYLGDIAIPFPFSFGTPVGQRDVTNYRVWEFEEISRQSQRFLIDQNFKERAAAIRARRDRERAARGDTIR